MLNLDSSDLDREGSADAAAGHAGSDASFATPHETTAINDGFAERETNGRLRIIRLRQQDWPVDQALAVSRETLARAQPDHRMAFGGIEADVARVHLVETPRSALRAGGHTIILPPREAMSTSLSDLRRRSEWEMEHGFDQVSFLIPASALDRWADDMGIRRFGGLRYTSNAAGSDEVLRNMAVALLPSLRRPDEASSLFVDQMLLAVCGYVARTFGGPSTREPRRGGLAPWQERRAKAVIAENLTGPVSLQGLAEACRLSVSHFAKAFRETTGCTPHQWLLERRIDHAMTLMMDEDLTLSMIAGRCGFNDHSHFTRTFSRCVGQTPGGWRKTRVHGAVAPDDRPTASLGRTPAKTERAPLNGFA